MINLELAVAVNLTLQPDTCSKVPSIVAAGASARPQLRSLFVICSSESCHLASLS
jgi:hypothetical protein